MKLKRCLTNTYIRFSPSMYMFAQNSEKNRTCNLIITNAISPVSFGDPPFTSVSPSLQVRFKAVPMNGQKMGLT